MRGWSTDPAVQGILAGFSRLHAARLAAVEGAGGARPAALSGAAALREVVVGEESIGWVLLEQDGSPGSPCEAIVEEAASLVSTQVGALREIESLSGEIAETYEELNLLYNLSESLGALRDEEEICRAVLEKAQRVIGGERASILLCDADTGLLNVVAARNLPEGTNARAPILKTEGVSGWVATTGRAIIVDDPSRLPAEIPGGPSGMHADHRLAPTPLLSAPLRSRDSVLGVMNLSTKAFGKPFTSQDLKLAQAIASEAAVFIQIIRFIARIREGERLRNELEIARTIQQGLLPRREPVIPGMDVAGLCRPASDVGGDYYGFLEEAVPEMTGLAIMDVSGHSVGAAVCMASVRSVLRCEAWSRRSTREVIERVNDIVCQDLEEGGMYATLCYALYDHKTGELRYTNGGHPPPLLLKAGEQRCRRLSMGGMGIGICAGQAYREETLRMTAGDILLMYTDGLTEARGSEGQMYGETRLAQAVGRYRHSTAWEITSALVGEAAAFAGGAPRADDVALIVMKAISTTRDASAGSR